jgi:hypothetical protein
MKKFIIALCGILVATGAMCADEPSRLQKPKKTNVTPWWNTGTSYQTGITDFYPDVAQEFSDDRFFENHGTWSDEGAIIIWAAREIYEHGAKFCPVQIQAANQRLEYWVWMDYYWNDADTAWNNCTTVCVKGYTGSKCSTHGHAACPKEQGGNLGNGLIVHSSHIQHHFTDLPTWKSLRAENTLNGTTEYLYTDDIYRQTPNMTVISYENQYGTDDSKRSSTHVVLGVIDEKVNGVLVAPIQVIGHRSANGWGIKSWIKSAKSNGNGLLLCYDGYIPDTNGAKCVRDSQCGTSYDNPSGGTGDDQASCGTGKEYERYGPDINGTCLDCWENGTNKIYSRAGKKCVSATSYNHRQMESGRDSNDKKCWLKTDKQSFADCVTSN